MPDRPVIAVVIPAYRAGRTIARVVRGVPDAARRIYVVDDACPENAGDLAEATGDPRLTVIRRARNGGVGAAMKTGYARALADGADIVVKMDGDDQMDPAELENIVAPVLAGHADYAKGNRFEDRAALKAMPLVRLIGNVALSVMVKAVSGYRHVMDPTNGYTAIRRETLETLDLDRIADGYFFETDMLIRLNMIGARVVDVPIPARYGAAVSSLNIPLIIPRFLWGMACGLAARLLGRSKR